MQLKLIEPRRAFTRLAQVSVGRVLWQRDVRAAKIEDVHGTNTPASSTPVTDGERVYIWFNSAGLFCFDFAGKLVWEKRLAPLPIEWGSGSSPILDGNLLVLNCDSDAEDFLLAVDRRTGQTIWQTPRTGVERAWPIPVIWNNQIVISGAGSLRAYDPQDGKEVWRVDGFPRWLGPTPVFGHGLLYVASNGLDPDNFLLAIRPGGRGNVTNTHVAWRYDRNISSVPSPVIVGDYLFTVRDGGILTCLNAKTGTLVWQERLAARGNYYASPVAADGKIYLLSEEGITSVVAAKPVYEPLSVNPLGERCLASPAISGGHLYLRTDNSLYCITSPGSQYRPPQRRIR
jgi:outer membrane protein assembly factor BamB